MKLITGALTFLILTSFIQVNAADKPNIIFVLFDDLGWCEPVFNWPSSQFKMPNFDRMAKEGMRFSDAHSASAVCTPTRYGILTGRYPSRIGQFGVLTTFSPPIIPQDRLTVASLLKQNGYHTACVGKWHLGMNWVGGKQGTEKSVPIGTMLKDGPNAIGFDYFCGFTHARNISTIIEQNKVIANINPEDNQPLMLKKALAFIDEKSKSDKPFLLYFPLGTPHAPIVPSKEYLGKSNAKDTVKNDPKYGDWIYQGDDMLGQILNSLQKNNISDNTLIIATSDNGAEHRPYPPLRESKRSIYEGGHRVPFIAKWPKKINPASVCNEPICLNDFIATTAEIIGFKLPPKAAEDSTSLLPLFLNTPSTKTRNPIIHQSSAGDLAIRQGPWKLIFQTNGKKELYNLDDDKLESKDLAIIKPEVTNGLTEKIESIIQKGRSTPGLEQKNDVKIQLHKQKQT